MKRIVLLVALSLLVSINATCQNADLFDKYSQASGVRSQQIGPAMLKIALFTVNGKEKALLKGVKRMKILDFTSAGDSVRNDYLEDVASLTGKGFILVSDVNENDSRIISYALCLKNAITRLIMITIDLKGESFISTDLVGDIPFSSILGNNLEEGEKL